MMLLFLNAVCFFDGILADLPIETEFVRGHLAIAVGQGLPGRSPICVVYRL